MQSICIYNPKAMYKSGGTKKILSSFIKRLYKINQGTDSQNSFLKKYWILILDWEHWSDGDEMG